MNLQEKTLTELKALAYDVLVQQEIVNTTLQAIYSEMQKRQTQHDPGTTGEEIKGT